MEHQYPMQQQQQHRPIQTHDLPARFIPRPRGPTPPRPRRQTDGGGRGGGGPETRHRGHIMQSRTSSQAHVITKRSRSRGKGLRRRDSEQQDQHQVVQHPAIGRRALSSSFSDRFQAESNASASVGIGSQKMHTKPVSWAGNMVREGKINEHGRCVRHPTIELCVRDSVTSEWRVLLQDCPLCSLDDSGHAPLRGEAAINKTNDGGSCSQATSTPSTKTNRTMTTEEESSVKSWTVSDASTSECESEPESETAPSTAEHLFRPQRPPPPRGPPPKHAPSSHAAPPQDQYNIRRRGNQPSNLENQSFDPVQSLKELGRKHVIEAEHQASPIRPPPPPKRAPPPDARNKASHGNDNFRRSDTATSDVCQASGRRGNPRPPPRYRLAVEQSVEQVLAPSGTAASATRGGKGGGFVGVNNDSNDNILGEASDIIARMESLTEAETRAEIASPPSHRSTRRQQQQQHQMNLPNVLVENENGGLGDDVGLGDAVAARIADADDSLARAQRRKKKAERKAERKAARLRAREEQRQSHSDGTFTMPMKESSFVGVVERGRGTNDILQAAAQIRARARRSTSRSRERVREASLFCGELPKDDDGADDEYDNKSMSSEKKRSILNPHGLENHPRPAVVERRSQSRDRQRSQSGGSVKGDRRFGGGRSRNSKEDHGHLPNHQLTTAEELITRRREQRQKILQRQQDAESRKGHRSAGSGTREIGDHLSHLSLKEEVLQAWSSSAQGPPLVAHTGERRSSRKGDNTGREPSRRGRSRSVVRDGFSRIRSSSLFRKKGGSESASQGGGDNMWSSEFHVEDSKSRDSSIDGSKMSTSSFRRMLSRGKPRSRSRGRRSFRRSTSRSGEEYAAMTEMSNEYLDQRVGDFDARSDGEKSKLSASTRSSFSVFKRSMSRGRTGPNADNGGVRGRMRSLSRGRFRNNKNDIDSARLKRDEGRDRKNYSWENTSMNSNIREVGDDAWFGDEGIGRGTRS